MTACSFLTTEIHRTRQHKSPRIPITRYYSLEYTLMPVRNGGKIPRTSKHGFISRIFSRTNITTSRSLRGWGQERRDITLRTLRCRTGTSPPLCITPQLPHLLTIPTWESWWQQPTSGQRPTLSSYTTSNKFPKQTWSWIGKVKKIKRQETKMKVTS